MLTVSRRFINEPLPRDGPIPVIEDFTALVAKCMSYGWEFKTTPTEDDYQEYIIRGRAWSLFEKKWSDDLGQYHQVLHLVRGYRETSRLSNCLQRYSVGGWTAWLEIVIGYQPYQKRPDLDGF